MLLWWFGPSPSSDSLVDSGLRASVVNLRRIRDDYFRVIAATLA